ncbi:hypothetical protein NDU88_004401 [Pleurodeles waltl]|uniref:Uncharacterized protein n=1 Tax=Pleurodeles waltl TaxID=8319 RepID=A0AAV7TRT6_PLEWA|nr:hypothetical protein NDU88_004401 [Pleurodeles waltl]
MRLAAQPRPQRAVATGPITTASAPLSANSSLGDLRAIKRSLLLVFAAAPPFQGTLIGPGSHHRWALLTSCGGPRRARSIRPSCTLQHLWRSPHRSCQPYGLKVVAGTVLRDLLLRMPFCPGGRAAGPLGCLRVPTARLAAIFNSLTPQGPRRVSAGTPLSALQLN